MIKSILVISLSFLAVSAAVTPITDFTQFFQGFNDQLAIESDTAFNSCEKIPLVSDLLKTYSDLNNNKTNPIALVADVMALYKDYNNIKSNCPQLEKAYDQFFANFTQAVETDPKKVGIQVLQNVMGNFEAIEEALEQVKSDISSKNFYDLGENVGKVVGLALTGYIN